MHCTTNAFSTLISVLKGRNGQTVGPFVRPAPPPSLRLILALKCAKSGEIIICAGTSTDGRLKLGEMVQTAGGWSGGCMCGYGWSPVWGTGGLYPSGVLAPEDQGGPQPLTKSRYQSKVGVCSARQPHRPPATLDIGPRLSLTSERLSMLSI